MDTRAVIDYCAQFDLDPKLIGIRLSAGKQHTIYTYGERQVIKVPKHSLYMNLYGPFHYETIVRDLTILQDYVGDYVAQTAVLKSRTNDTDYVIMQERLFNATFLTGEQFELVKGDFLRIIEANRSIIQQHQVSIDFFGNIGFQRSIVASILRQKRWALMNNILIVPDKTMLRLKIADTNLSELRFHYHEEVGIVQWLVDSAVFQMTKWLIQDNFGVRLMSP